PVRCAPAPHLQRRRGHLGAAVLAPAAHPRPGHPSGPAAALVLRRGLRRIPPGPRADGRRLAGLLWPVQRPTDVRGDRAVRYGCLPGRPGRGAQILRRLSLICDSKGRAGCPGGAPAASLSPPPPAALRSGASPRPPPAPAPRLSPGE